MTYFKRKVRGITELKCTKCGETKPVSEFSRRNHIGSWYSHCKKCCAIKSAEYNRRVRSRKPKSNKNGFPGVVCINGIYRARITMHGKQYWLGYRKTAEEASALYLAQKAEYLNAT